MILLHIRKGMTIELSYSRIWYYYNFRVLSKNEHYRRLEEGVVEVVAALAGAVTQCFAPETCQGFNFI